MCNCTVKVQIFSILILIYQVLGFSACQCGSYGSNSARIIAGRATTIEEHPHQISLEIRGHHACGGSIISRYLILTASHCTFNQSIYDLAVRVGSSLAEEGGRLIKIRRIHMHPYYDKETNGNDVAVLLLKDEIEFSTCAQPIRLASASDPPLEVGEMAVVTGWGAYTGLVPHNQLNEANAPIVDTEWCRELYDLYTTRLLGDSVICAEDPKGDERSCYGDSGGPLVLNYVQIGVVSWGLGCDLANFPNIFASVSYLREFIDVIANRYGIILRN